MGRNRSRSRSRRREKRDEKEDEEEDEEDLSPEGRVALLEVENETLKAENKELRKKLVEALRRGGGGGGGGGAAERRRGGDNKKEEKKESSRRREASPEQEAFDEKAMNAVLLVNASMEAYNESITNNIALERRLPLVEEKMKRFMENFGDKIEIIEMNSGKAVIKDRSTFIKRYSCVFRESGAKLAGSTNKRFYYDVRKGPTYCIDYETHESLVTAQPGTPPDGKLGCREARTEHLIVLYEEKDDKISRMWIRPDTDKTGTDTMAGEDVIAATPMFKKFEAKIEELLGTSKFKQSERIFHNYLQIETIG
eukprot:TRINITY_DN14328_c5_g1_i1.p1 TRINITY_DN14328_c5_g1~~TRINITY_DN14328_c5_g1_i1.p1  ORF type:complete len:310 (+),score=80.09 TRINITY_DN14328_c5_g1_i1:65-994(+)